MIRSSCLAVLCCSEKLFDWDRQWNCELLNCDQGVACSQSVVSQSGCCEPVSLLCASQSFMSQSVCDGPVESEWLSFSA